MFSKKSWREFLGKGQKKTEFWNEYEVNLWQVWSKFEVYSKGICDFLKEGREFVICVNSKLMS